MFSVFAPITTVIFLVHQRCPTLPCHLPRVSFPAKNSWKYVTVNITINPISDRLYVYMRIYTAFIYIYTHLFLCVYMILFVFSTWSIINWALIHFVANRPRRFKGLYPSGAAIISGNGPYNQEGNGGYDVVESWLAFLLVWCVMLCLNLYEIMFF